MKITAKFYLQSEVIFKIWRIIWKVLHEIICLIALSFHRKNSLYYQNFRYISISKMSHLERVIVLVDMDCFYCQVEEKLNPFLKGKPMAVVQYNAWKGGGIIAVNYAARDRGVTRHMRGDEAKQKCPEIELVRVPCIRGKADLSKYREAGKKVAKVLQRFTPLIERASVDEAYLDITETVKSRLAVISKEVTLSEIKNTHVAACDTMDFLYNLYNGGLHIENNLRLTIGAVIVEEIRAAVYNETGYTCSAGIAHNKILAKLACGLNKPNKQTVLPQDNIQDLYKDLPVRKIRSLGGKFGNTLSEDLGITKMAELHRFSEKELTRRYDEKTASFLYNIARGINNDPVTARLVAKSIGCCKKFAGKAALIDIDSVKHWLNELSVEIVERLEQDLEENNRKAKQIVIGFAQEINGKDVASSRTHPLNSYDPTKISNDAYEIIKKNCLKPSGTFCIKYLGLNVGKFETCKNINEITTFFKAGDNKINTSIVREQSIKPDEDSDSKSELQPTSTSRTNNINCRNAVEKPGSIQSFFKNSEKKNEDSHQISDSELEFKETEAPVNFSDTTEEADENSSEFKFFNEDRDASDNDSISNELSGDNKTKTTESNPEKESFFLRYFESLKRERKSPIVRDFNTSRNLENLDEDSNNGDECQEESNIANNTHAIPGTSKDFMNDFEQIEVCSECNKRVPEAEMVSHMDYHFALKIMHEEKELYKQQSSAALAQKQSKTEIKKTGKRKHIEVEKNATLKEFFKIEPEQLVEGLLENTELCPQCNKRINIASFTSHLDYHAAKRLHMEINPVKSCVAESVKKTKTKKHEKTKDVKRDSIPSVMAFFKQ
ncbi:hypothetical protein ILUMI_08756, partial [Ignelater luminosus]